MNRNDNFDDRDDMTFLERHKLVLSVVALVVIGVGVYLLQSKFSKPGSSQHKGQEIVNVRLPASLPTPPPPAPTPPPPEIKQDEKMIEQAPVDDKEDKPDTPPEAPAVTTNLTGTGPDPFGLKAGSGGSSSLGSSSAQRSKYGWYAAQVQGTVSEALRKDPRMRKAAFNMKVRIWPDITGRVSRAKLAATTNDPKLDEAITEALTGLQLKEPPPKDMPAPIVMRINATASPPH